MATDGRKLNDEAVKRLQDDIVARYGQVGGLLNKLQGILDQMEGQWRGIGASAFNQKQNEINQHMVHIGRLLERFLENINLTRRDKDNLEDEVRAPLQSIEVQSGGKSSVISSF